MNNYRKESEVVGRPFSAAVPGQNMLANTYFQPAVKKLLSGHIRSLGAFRPVNDIERHFLAFREGLETLFQDGGVVNEDVFALVRFDEAVTFGVIEPFHFSRWHAVMSSLR
jgi:hypothetical protein